MWPDLVHPPAPHKKEELLKAAFGTGVYGLVTTALPWERAVYVEPPVLMKDLAIVFSTLLSTLALPCKLSWLGCPRWAPGWREQRQGAEVGKLGFCP